MIDRVGLPALPPELAARKSIEKTEDAARQFEALMLGQMLKSIRDSSGGALSWDGDSASSTAMEYAQEMFAQALAAGGGLGLARIVVKGLQEPQKP